MAVKRRRLWIVGVMALALIAGAVAYVLLRGGRTFRGDLAELLPSETAAFLVMEDGDGFAKQMRQSSVYANLTVHADFSRMLVSDEDLGQLRKAGLPLTREPLNAMLGRFASRWFGQRVALAFFKAQGMDQPALVLLAQTRAGFEENLGELVASVWPSTRRQTSEYRGVGMTLIRADEPDEAIGYCRFGKTVAVSLFLDSTVPLQMLIDRRQDGNMDTMADEEAFQRFEREVRTDQGVSLYVRGKETISLLATHSRLNLSKHERSRGNLRFLEGLLASSRPVGGRILVEQEPRRLAVQLFPYRDPRERPEPQRGALIEALEGPSLIQIHGASSSLPETVRRFTFGFPEEAEVRQESVEWNERLVRDFGVDLERELIPLLGTEMGILLRDVRPGLILPQVRAAVVAQVADPQAAQALLERAWNHYESRLAQRKSVELEGIRRVVSTEGRISYVMPTDLPGGMSVAVRGQHLILAMPESFADEIAESLETAETQEHPKNRLEMQADLRGIGRAIGSTAGPIAIWDRDVREDLQDMRPWLELLRELRSARLEWHWPNDGNDIVFTVPLD